MEGSPRRPFSFFRPPFPSAFPSDLSVANAYALIEISQTYAQGAWVR
jgi:hypothetical protein